MLVSLAFWYFFTRYEPEKEQFLSVVKAELAAEKECLKQCYSLAIYKGFSKKDKA